MTEAALIEKSAQDLIRNLPSTGENGIKKMDFPQIWAVDVLKLPKIETLGELLLAAKENRLPPIAVFKNPEGMVIQTIIQFLKPHPKPEALLVVSG